MPSILFVCTGNIFRSMTAEYVCKAAVGTAPRYGVGSAGTEARPYPMSEVVKTRLLERGIDPSGHQQRKLTAGMLAVTDVVVAMGLDHRRFIQEEFDHKAWLFNKICYDQATPILDVWEAVPNWVEDSLAQKRYALEVVDYICEAMPKFVRNVGWFLE